MTYTELKTEHCPPLDMLLSGKGYFPELDCSMRQWFTDGLQKGLSTPEERAAGHTLSGACNAGIELCTPEGEFHLCICSIPHPAGVCVRRTPASQYLGPTCCPPMVSVGTAALSQSLRRSSGCNEIP